MTAPTTLHLIERRSRICRLAPVEVDYLLAHHRGAFEILPTVERHRYRVTPAGVAGVVVTPGRRIVVASKVPLPNLLLLNPLDDLSAGRDSMEPAGAGDVIDLLAGQLALRMNERAAAGLHRGYRETARQGAFLVGRLDVAQQIRQQARGNEQIHSRSDEFTAELPCNQVPRTVAGHLLASGLLGVTVRGRLAAALAPFAHLEEVPLTSDTLAGIQRDRLPADYVPLLDLCRLLIDSLTPSHSSGTVPAPAFLLPLEPLFERYVTRAVQEAFAGDDAIQVTAQQPHRVGEPLPDQPIVYIRPDVGIGRGRNGRPDLVIDAKWKRLPTTSVITDDLYQVLAYCAVLGASRAVLVYPGRRRRVWDYAMPNIEAIVQVRTLDVSGDAEQCRRARRRLGRELRAMME